MTDDLQDRRDKFEAEHPGLFGESERAIAAAKKAEEERVAKKIERQKRYDAVFELRKKGYSFAHIGKELGITPQRVFQIFHKIGFPPS